MDNALNSNLTGDMDVILEIEEGFLYSDFESIVKHLDLDQKAQADMLGCSVSTVARLKDKADGKLSGNQSDKMSCYLAILKLLIVEKSMTTADAITWLHTPQDKLLNRATPVTYTQTAH